MCNGDRMDIDEPMDSVKDQTSEGALVPLSDEWFADLDESFNNIGKLLEELQHQGTKDSTLDDYHILGADQRLLCMQEDMTRCLITLHDGEQYIENSAFESEGSLTEFDGSSCVILTPVDERERDRDEEPAKPSSVLMRTPEMELYHSEDPRAPSKPRISNVQLSPGESVMKQLFRWWQPYRSDCLGDMRRLVDNRMTEVDGLIQ